MSHTQTTRNPMSEARRNAVHGPLQSDTDRTIAWPDWVLIAAITAANCVTAYSLGIFS